MNKIVAAVIFYNPNEEAFARVERYSEIFDSVYIFDNTEGKKYKYESHKNIYYLSEKGNMGLPYAYNALLRELGNDVEYMCMLDQDSEFENEQIQNLLGFMNNNSINLAAIYAPAIQYRYYNTFTKNEYEERDWVITSGSFLNVKIVKQNNLSFDENYFIDRFEVDMCHQLRKKGYKIIQVNCSCLKQELGTDSGHRHPNHSPIRHYYLARNRLYYNKKYYGFIKRWFLNILQSIRHVLLIRLYECDYSSKIRACVDGWNDYRVGHFGKK